jgi:hypothetical protein
MLKFPGCHRRLGRARISGALHAFRQDVRGVQVYRTASWSAAARLSTSNKLVGRDSNPRPLRTER